MRRFAHNAKSQFVGPSPYDRLPSEDSDPVKIYPSQTANQIKWGLIIAALVIAVPALIMSAVSLSYGKNDVSDPLNLDGATITNLTVDTIKVNTLLDADMANVIPGTWMMPPPPSKKRSTATYDVVPADRQILLGRSGVTYDLRFPKQLSGYVSREFHVYSNTSQAHTILLTNALNSGSCETSYSDVTWDSERKFPLVKFKDVPGAYIHFKVVDCGTLTLIESRFVDFCTANMSHCEHPKRDVNADWADIENLNVDNVTANIANIASLQFSERVYENTEMLDPSASLHTLNGNDAIDAFLPRNLSAYVGKQIRVCSNSGKTDRIVHENLLVRFAGYGSMGCCVDLHIAAHNKITALGSSDCAEVDKFHGWWRQQVKRTNDQFYVFGMPLVYINKTTFDPFITCYGGTPTRPREIYTPAVTPYLWPSYATWDNGTVTYPHYTQSDKVVSGDPFPDFQFFNDYQQNLAVHQPSGLLHVGFTRESDGVNGHFATSTWYSRTPIPEIALRSTGAFEGELPASDPRSMFRNAVDVHLHDLNPQSHPDYNSTFAEFSTARALAETIMDTGVQHTSAVHNIFKTQGGSGLTVLRTVENHQVMPPAIVTVSGLTGDWAVFNGDLQVSAALTSMPRNVDPDYVDYGPDPDSRTIHHEVGVFFDSSSLPATADGVAIITGTPQVTVSYGPIDASTNYIRTIGAIAYWANQVIGEHDHTGIRVYRNNAGTFDTKTSPVEWSDVQAIQGSGAWFNFVDFAQIQFSGNAGLSASQFYQNPASFMTFVGVFSTYNQLDSRLIASDLNGRFQVRPEQNAFNHNGQFWYNIARENYLENVTVPMWKTIGTTRIRPANLVAQAMYPGGGGDEFEFILNPFDDALPADFTFFDNRFLSSQYPFFPPFGVPMFKEFFFVGRIREDLTNGPKIGYIRLQHMLLADAFQFIFRDEFMPTELLDQQLLGRGAVTKLFAQIIDYLQTDLECETIIIDIRGNPGGYAQISVPISDVFGTDVYQIYSNNLRSPQVDLTSPLLDLSHVQDWPNDLKKRPITELTKMPNVTNTVYGSSHVFNDGTVYLMRSTSSLSASEFLTNAFLGRNEDKQLGGNTQVKIVGSTFGKQYGFNCGGYFPPIAESAPKLVDNANNGVPVYELNGDCGRTQRRPSGVSFAVRSQASKPDAMPSLSGSSGSNALPEDWETLVYPDIGHVNNTRPQLPGDTRPQTPTFANRDEWRDAWLEQAVLDSLAAKKKRSLHSATRTRKEYAHLNKRSPTQIMRDASRFYKRDVSCGAYSITGTIASTPKTIAINYDNSVRNSLIHNPQKDAEMNRALKAVADMMVREMHNGGLCVDQDGSVKVTSACVGLPYLNATKPIADIFNLP